MDPEMLLAVWTVIVLPALLAVVGYAILDECRSYNRAREKIRAKAAHYRLALNPPPASAAPSSPATDDADAPAGSAPTPTR